MSDADLSIGSDEATLGDDSSTLGDDSSTLGDDSSIASGEETLSDQEEEVMVKKQDEQAEEEKGTKRAIERSQRETVGEVKWDVDAIFKGKGDHRIDVTTEVMAVIASHHLQPNNKPATVRRYKAALNHCINAKPTKVETMLGIPLKKRTLEALENRVYTTEYEHRILQASSFFSVEVKEVNGMLIELEQKLKNMPDLVEDKKNEPSVDESDERVPWPEDVNDETKPKEVRLKAFVDHLFRHVTDPEELLCLDWMAKCMANPEHYGSNELNVCQRAKILDYFHLALPSLHASPFELDDVEFDHNVPVKIIKIDRSMMWNGGVDVYAEPHELLDKYPEMLERKAAKEKENAEKKEKERMERRAKAKDDRQKKREEERAQKEIKENEMEKKRESKRLEKEMREKEEEKKKRERWEKEMKKGGKYEDDVDSVALQDQSSDVREARREKKRESKRVEKVDEKTKRERFANGIKKVVKWEDEIDMEARKVAVGDESKDREDSDEGDWADAVEGGDGRRVKEEVEDEEEIEKAYMHGANGGANERKETRSRSSSFYSVTSVVVVSREVKEEPIDSGDGEGGDDKVPEADEEIEEIAPRRSARFQSPPTSSPSQKTEKKEEESKKSEKRGTSKGRANQSTPQCDQKEEPKDTEKRRRRSGRLAGEREIKE